MVLSLQGCFVAVLAVMVGYTLARSICGLLSSERTATFDNTALFTHYTVAQGLIGLALVHGFRDFCDGLRCDHAAHVLGRADLGRAFSP